MQEHDVVIIGSGLGGLACGAMLAREGQSVCIIEKNRQIGGTLQTFSRDKTIFDSGVHYVGSLDKGQKLNQLFRFLGIMDKLKISKMNEDAFDVVLFRGDPKRYRHGQGYDRFINNLVADFPEEEEAIHKYCDFMQEVCSKFPLYNLRTGHIEELASVLEIDTYEFIESLTSNIKLQNVLGGTNPLYAGVPHKTPFYVHALITNSYIESAYRFVGGGSQIARYLAKEITSRKGVIIRNTQVMKLHEENGRVQYAETDKGEKIYGKNFISNLHPQNTLDLVKSEVIRKTYRERIMSLENSISVFCINAVMKKHTFPNYNQNFYYYTEDNPWSHMDYTEENWPMGFFMFASAAADAPEYCAGVSIMSCMRYDDVKKWEHTFNTDTNETNRGADYDEFKKEKGEKLLSCTEEIFPGIRDCIHSWYASTPLSMRDYIGTSDGSLYGITKDYKETMKTIISAKTKIPNLLLTGQNLHMHGILGVTISSVVTCAELLGMEYLIEKIRNA